MTKKIGSGIWTLTAGATCWSQDLIEPVLHDSSHMYMFFLPEKPQVTWGRQFVSLSPPVLSTSTWYVFSRYARYLQSNMAPVGQISTL